MVRMPGDVLAPPRLESSNLSGRALEAVGMGRPAENVILSRSVFDLVQKRVGIFFSALRQDAADDRGHGQSIASAGQLPKRVRANTDAAAVHAVEPNAARLGEHERFEIRLLHVQDELKAVG